MLAKLKSNEQFLPLPDFVVTCTCRAKKIGCPDNRAIRCTRRTTADRRSLFSDEINKNTIYFPYKIASKINFEFRFRTQWALPVCVRMPDEQANDKMRFFMLRCETGCEWLMPSNVTNQGDLPHETSHRLF